MPGAHGPAVAERAMADHAHEQGPAREVLTAKGATLA